MRRVAAGARSILPESRAGWQVAAGGGCHTWAMPPLTIVLTALVLAVTAMVLTRWMRGVAGEESEWLGIGLHVLLAGFGGAGAAALARTELELVAFGGLALSCALLAVIDLATFRLPDIITGPTYLFFFTALLAAAGTTGEWGRFGRAVAGGAVLLLVYFILAFINPAGLGLGDVKLAGILGGFLGWFGWLHVMSGTLAAFLLSGLVAITLLVTRRATMKTDFPFGPWMIAGAMIGVVWGGVP